MLNWPVPKTLPAEYILSLRVTDDDGLTDTRSLRVTARPSRLRESPPIELTSPKAVATGGKFYVFGILQEDFFAFDLASNTWTRKALRLAARSDFGITVLDEKIYLPGSGPTSVFAGKTMEAYDPSLDKWILKADLPRASRIRNAVSHDGKIFAFPSPAILQVPSFGPEIYTSTYSPDQAPPGVYPGAVGFLFNHVRPPMNSSRAAHRKCPFPSYNSKA